MKNKKFVSFFLVAAALLYAQHPLWLLQKIVLVKQSILKAENEQENIPDFDKEIIRDGQKYTLSGVSVRTLKKTPRRRSPVFNKRSRKSSGSTGRICPAGRITRQ